jgi:hypothetical protein
MHDITDRLAALGRGEAPAPSDAVVHDDVTRGRVAAKRQRQRRIAFGAVGTAGVAAAAVAIAVPLATGSGGRATTQAGGSAASAAPAAAVQLVAYAGQQQPGFVVTEVPDGYVLQGATPYSLDIALPSDHSDLNSFENKLVVMLQSKDAHNSLDGKQVTVHGSPGAISGHDGGVRWLEYNDGSHEVLIQCWSNVGLTDEQLVQFADGVTVTSSAVAGVG